MSISAGDKQVSNNDIYNFSMIKLINSNKEITFTVFGI